LRDTLKRIKESSHQLGARELSQSQKAEVEKLEAFLMQQSGKPPLGGLALSNREEEIDTVLRNHGNADLWQLAADLAQRNVDPQTLEQLFATMEGQTARAALVRIAASLEVASLLDQIESSTARISDLVRAIKEYTFMDQAPVQNVDVVKSLENTLTILNYKLKHGVAVERDYGAVPLLVNSFGSDLNQVWTNIIDNAIDAMKGEGKLRVRTYSEGDFVVVEIVDDGPGIPEEIQPRIFEPFFTTKKVGEGTGLGLDTVQRIVKKHQGSIQVESKPGKTCFQIWLPLSPAAAA
jgi:signal transduction histidine kinase